MSQERKWGDLSLRERWVENYVLAARGMRDAGRWVLGLVAGLLLAATNLSGFGRLNPEDGRFWLAVIAAAVTGATIGRIVYLFLRVQIAGEIDLEKLTPNQFALVQEYGILKDYPSKAEFHAEQQKTLAEYARVNSSIGATPLVLHESHRHDLLNRHKTLSDKLEVLEWDRQDVIALLSWHPTKLDFDRARMALLRLGIVAAIAAMTLVWTVNPPEPRAQTIVVLAATPVSQP